MAGEKEKLVLRMKLEVDGEAKYFIGVRDATTLGTFWAGCMDMGAIIAQAQAACKPYPNPHHHTPQKHTALRRLMWLHSLHRSQEISVVVVVHISDGPKKLCKPSRPRGVKHTEDETKFKGLVKMVYGEHPGHYAEGEWTEEATELVRGEPGWVTVEAQGDGEADREGDGQRGLSS